MVVGSSEFKIQTTHLKSGDSLVIVIEKNKYSLGGSLLHHEVAILTFTTNQKNVFCEEFKAQLLDKVYFQVIFQCVMFSDLEDLEEENIDIICYAICERVHNSHH